jgi:hypothetical protein
MPSGTDTRKEETMRKVFQSLLVPAAFAMVAGATLAAPAKADFYLNFGAPLHYSTPYYYAPPAYYYAPRCYWDGYYGRVCY